MLPLGSPMGLSTFRNDPHLHLARGNLAVRRGDLAAAEEEFLKADKAAPKLMTTKIWLGRYYSTRGMSQQSASQFRGAISASSNRPEGWLLRGALQFRQGQGSESMKSLQRADELDLFDRTAEERLARLYLQSDDLVGANRWYRAALKLTPDSRRLLLARAQIEMRLELPVQAESRLEGILKGEEDAMALMLLAQLKEMQKQQQQARAVYLRILKLEPKNVVANNNLAMLLIRLNESPAEALRYAEIARRAAPNSSATLS